MGSMSCSCNDYTKAYVYMKWGNEDKWHEGNFCRDHALELQAKLSPLLSSQHFVLLCDAPKKLEKPNENKEV